MTQPSRRRSAFLERTAVKARTGHNGVGQVDGEGLIAAAFRHRTSRAGDPQLHTHVVVANATHCGDGAWRSLDARWIYGYARTAGFLYQAELRRQLTARLGVSWSDVDKGVAEIAGIDRRVLREFSRRRIEIEHALGTDPSSVGAARTAALATRPAKPTDSFESLLTDWRTRAEALGADIEGAVVQSPSPAPSTAPSAAPTEVAPLELGEELCTNRAVFDRRDVLRALASRAVSGARPADIEAAADRFLTEESVVELTSDRFGPRFTTAAQLALEDRLMRRALDGVGAGTGRCWEKTSPDEDLSDEQAAMVEAITTDGNDVSVVVGVAGSGKTHALLHAAHAWRSEEFEVIGCALAARAAANLEEGAAIPASTIERLLGDLGAGRRHLTSRSVVIVDEAAMVGTATITRLLDQTTSVGAKLVLVGDHRQLPEIEAGGAFAALAHALSSATLTTNRRQDDPEDRRILAELRHGDPTAAWQGLERRDRIRSFDHDDRAKQQMVEDWFAATRRGSAAVMLALYRSDVDDLNLLARQRMKAHHRLGLAELVVDDLPFAVGDRVVALRNRYDLGLLNGDSGTVRSIHPGTRSLRVQLDRGTQPRVPIDYLADGHLTHGYATTIHKAQGLTCDEAFVYADESIYREAGYTALSRARHQTRLYLATSDHSQDPASLLNRSRAEYLATDQRRTNEPAEPAGIDW